MEPLTTTSPAPVNFEAEATETSAEKPRVFDPRAALDTDALKELRVKQQEVVDFTNSFYADTFDEEKRTSMAHDSVEETVKQYLEDNGLKEGDETYLLYRATLSNLSINSIPESEWYVKLADNQPEDGTVLLGQAGMDKARMYYQQLTGKPYYEPNDPTLNEEAVDDKITAEHFVINGETVYGSLEVHRNKLNAMRDKLAELSSKRQGRAFGKGKAYDALLAQYNEQVVLLGKLEHKDLIENEEADETAKTTKVVEYLFEEQKKLRLAALKKIQDTNVSWFVDKMNSGTKMERFGKGVLLGLGAAGVGAGIGALAGVAGVAALGVGAAAGITAAARFARGFARSDGKNGRGMQQLEQKHLEAAKNAGYGDAVPTNFVDSIQDYFNKQLEYDTKAEQQKRKKSIYAGVGGVALGAIGVGIIATAIENGAVDVAADHLNSSLSHTAEAPTYFDTNPIPQEGESIVPHSGTYDTSANFIDADTTSIDVTSGSELVENANFVVDPAEGGIHFFQDMGLTQADWYDMQFDLLKEFDNDFYLMNDGNVGLKNPGEISIQAQKYIQDKFALAA